MLPLYQCQGSHSGVTPDGPGALLSNATCSMEGGTPRPPDPPRGRGVPLLAGNAEQSLVFLPERRWPGAFALPAQPWSWPSALVDPTGGRPIPRAGPELVVHAPHTAAHHDAVADGQHPTASTSARLKRAAAGVTHSDRETQRPQRLAFGEVGASNSPSPVSHPDGRLQAPSNRRGTSMDEVSDRAVSRNKFGTLL